MRIACFPGTFDPFHRGHLDVVKKALQVFDKVMITRLRNPAKALIADDFPAQIIESIRSPLNSRSTMARICYQSYDGLLVDFLVNNPCDAIIRGLRNGADLEYERNLQYWNEDLGLDIPVFYILTNRADSHISSTAIRELKSLGKAKAHGF